MKTMPEAGAWPKLAQSGIRVAGGLILIGLVVGLVSAWAFIGSVCELGKWMLGSGKPGKKSK
jgi:hypothetical protein